MEYEERKLENGAGDPSVQWTSQECAMERTSLLQFRDLIVWQKAMEAAEEMYRLAPTLPREEAFGMRSQITRAAVSIPANIAEGWTRESNKEKAHFLAIVQGSLAECDTLLTLCERIGWFPESDTVTIRSLHTEVSRMLSSLRRRYRTSS